MTTCSGAITISYVGWTTSTCNGGTSCNLITLPVDFLSFTGKLVNGSVLLNWKTSSELNNMGFVVEKTVNGEKWDSIGWMPGNGNSNEINSYTFLDEKILGNRAYYRLKQLDYDGKYEHSAIVYVMSNLSNQIVISPNPVLDEMRFSEHEFNVKIIDGMGRELQANKVFNGKLDISNLHSGMYILEIDRDGLITHHRIIKK